MTKPKYSSAIAITQVPGIIYSPLEHRARIQGTGIEVFEIVYVYRSVGRSWEHLQRAFNWLTPEQLRATLTFAEKNPEFVNAELEQQDAALESVDGARPSSDRKPR